LDEWQLDLCVFTGALYRFEIAGRSAGIIWSWVVSAAREPAKAKQAKLARKKKTKTQKKKRVDYPGGQRFLEGGARDRNHGGRCEIEN
jgi:sRNA-binding protein